MKTELEVGKWYKSDYGVIKYFVTENRAYGINAFKEWKDESNGHESNGHELNDKDYWKPATDKEVESALIAEAKKRGFKRGLKTTPLWETSHWETLGEFDFRNKNTLYLGCAIFNNGQWAEIIEEQPIPSIHPSIDDIRSHENNFVIPSKVGQEITKEHLKDINTPIHYNNETSTGTLYNVATIRKWSPYLFDIVKRLERAEEKGEFDRDLDKSIDVIKLWKLERNNSKK